MNNQFYRSVGIVLLGSLIGSLIGFLISFLVSQGNNTYIAIFIGLIALIFLSLICLRRYTRGWLLFAGLMPFWVLVDLRMPVWKLQIGFVSVMALLVAIFFISYFLLKMEKNLPRIPYLFLISLFIVFHLVSLFHGDSLMGLKDLIKLCGGIALYFLMVVSIKDTKLLEKMIKITLIVSAFVIAFLFYKYLIVYHSKVLGVRIFEETGSGKNQLGIYLLLFTPFALSWAIFKKHIYSIIIALLFLTASFYTLSRGAWISVLMAFVFLLFFSRRKWNCIKMGITIFFILFLFINFFYPFRAKEFLYQRAGTLITSQETLTFLRRKKLIRAGLEAFRENPILGVGLGNFQKISIRKGLRPYKSTHNNYIQILAEQGVISFILFIGLLLSIFWGNIKVLKRSLDARQRWLIEGVTASFFALVISSFFVKHYEILLFWFILGCSIIIAREM